MKTTALKTDNQPFITGEILRAFVDPAIVLSMILLSLNFVIVCGFFVLVLYYLFIYVLPLEIQLSKEEFRIPLACLTPTLVCVCPIPRPGFKSSYAVVFLCVM
jgi:hypothetical protein